MKKNILFITLFDLTETYLQIGEKLSSNCDVHYVATTLKSYRELLKKASPEKILNLSTYKKNIKLEKFPEKILAKYENEKLTISSIINASRIYYNEPTDLTLSYLALCAEKLDRFCEENAIDIVITEPSDGIQLLGQLICWKKKIKFGQISLTRYPTDRVMLNDSCFESGYYKIKNGNQLITGNEFNNVLKEKPSYYNDALKYKPIFKLAKSALRRIAALPKFVFGYYDFNELKPKYLFSIYLRNRIRKIYQHVARNNCNPDLYSEYIVYYMHVQPERSIDVISPNYRDQVELIKILRRCAPITCKILVKDHPAADGAQPLKFYRTIKKIAGVELVSGNVDSAILAKNSLAVATVSGTIGFEMGLVNHPVIVFSEIFYAELASVFKYTTPNALSEFLFSIKNANKYNDASTNELFMNSLLENSVSTDWNGGAGRQSPKTICAFERLILSALE